MKIEFKKILIVFLAIATLGIGACSKGDDDDDEDLSPKAIILANSTATPLDTVYLDGSTSENADNLEWTGSNPLGESIDFFSNDSEGNHVIVNYGSKVFFVAQKIGSYNIILNVTKDGKYNETSITINVSGAKQIGGTLTDDLILANINVYSTDSCDYFLSKDLIIPSGISLIIDDGVTICAAEGAAIIAEGSLYINGSSGVNIRALGNNWKGIHVKNSNSIITMLTIEGAGSSSFTNDPSEKAGLYIETNMNKLICTFKNNEGYGLVMKEGVYINESYHCTFQNNTAGPAILSFETFATFSQNNTFHTSSASSYLRLRGAAAKLGGPYMPKYIVPYLLTGDVETQDLNLQSGTKLYFSHNVGITIYGTLNATGSAAEPITLEGKTQVAGSWKGITCNAANLEYVSIKYAGSDPLICTNDAGFKYNCGLMANTLPRIRNCTLSDNNGYGFATYHAFDTYESNTISNNSIGAILTSAGSIAKMDNNNSVYLGYGSKPIVTIHGKSSLQLTGSTIGSPTWHKLSAATSSTDYKLLEGDYYTYGGVWYIAEGVFIECEENVGVKLNNNSNLYAQGSESEKIVFRGTKSTPGHWKGIFADAGSAIRLKFVEINYGGGGTGDFQGCLNVSSFVSTTLSFVTNCSFLNGGGYDLYFPNSTDILDIKNSTNKNIFSKSN